MSGSQIGGAAGAVVGGVIGFYTGNPFQGIQYGYAIGSAIGGYIDPGKTQGPRLTDAPSQTSTVGGVIPFGYGTFTTVGNIIWRDELKEHKKTQRVGKGSQENTTFTYTRSYAIGVCKGRISSYIWIKRNGKLVYAADPAALGAAMGWDSQLIADLAASSAAFLKKCVLYYGTADQMPDPTQVAVEGAGNVSPNRGLAKIVLTDDDLTDVQGAVGQYEFCIARGAAKSYTTPPYPVMVQDGIGIGSEPKRGARIQTSIDELDVLSHALDGSRRNVLQTYDHYPPEAIDIGSYALNGERKSVLLTYTHYPPEAIDIGSYALDGSRKNVLLIYLNYPPEAIDIGSYALDGSRIPL